MKYHLILCISLLATGASASGKTSGVSPAVVAAPAAKALAATTPAKAVLVDVARPAQATLLVAAASEEVCSCKRWVIKRERVCLEPHEDGSCSKWEYVEVSRECLEYVCHKK